MRLPSQAHTIGPRQKQVYGKKFSLEIDNQMLSARQTPHYVANFYNRMVSDKILREQDPKPLLKDEQKHSIL